MICGATIKIGLSGEMTMKDKIRKIFNKYVENGKLEQGLHKVNEQIRKRKGKDFSKYIDKIMKKLQHK